MRHAVTVPQPMYRYRDDVCIWLAGHGVMPKPHTPPELVHELVSDLYRYEIRRLRDRLVRGEFPRAEYAGRIVELRRRYPLVSLKPAQFVE